MGNFSMTIPKINYSRLWNLIRERKAHTHIHTPPLYAQPDALQPLVAYGKEGLNHWDEKAQNPLTDKRELTGFKPSPKHSSHKGPYKYL